MPTATTTQRLLVLGVLLALTHPAFAQLPPVAPPTGSSSDISGFLAEIRRNIDWEGLWKPIVKVVVQFLIGVGAIAAMNSKGAAIQQMVGHVLVFLVALAAIAFVGTL